MPTSMQFWLQQLWLYARFECYRLFRSPRGWFSLAAFTVIWYFLLRYPILQAAEQLQQPEIQHMLANMLGFIGMRNLLDWPLPELSVYWVLALVLMPIAIIFSAADQTCSDRSRGTLRLYMLRSSRSVLFLGRFTGQILVQAILIGASLAATLLVASWRIQQIPPLESFNTALIILLNLLILLAPVTALMALCSALCKSSRLAISLAIVLVGLSSALCGYLVWQFPDLYPLLQYLPLAQLPELFQSQGWATLQHAGLPLTQAAVLLTLGLVVMNRRAL